MEMYKIYQCPGCINGDNCFKKDNFDSGCKYHYPGTGICQIGKIFLGLPTGFNRLGQLQEMKMYIYESYEEKEKCFQFDKFNIPCWKYLDKNGNTIVRGLQPRLNMPFIQVLKGNHIDKINCLEITDDDIKAMD